MSKPGAVAERVTTEEIDLLHAMVAEPSFSGSEERLACLLRERLNGAGWQADIDATGNLVAELGTGPQTLLFLGHLDTAPGWLPARIGGGALWGRGSVDAKGALAAFIAGAGRAAMRERRDHGTGVGLPLRLVLIAAVGEEADSRGARAILGSCRPEWCVVGEPSGWDGVTLGYKGSQAARVTVSCPSGHGGGPGLSAAEIAAEYWHALSSSLAAPATGAGFRKLTCSLRGFNTSSDGLTDSAELNLDWRVPPGVPSGEPERLMADAARSEAQANTRAQISWRAGELIPGFVAGKNNVLVRSFLSGIRAGGGQPRFKLKSGTSDMNLVGPAWECPILAYGPGDSAHDHTPEERLDLAEYAAAIEVWRTVVAGPGLLRTRT